MSVKLKNLTGAPLTIRTEERDVNFGVDGPAPEVEIGFGDLASLPVDLGEESEVAVGLVGSWGTPLKLPEQEPGVLLIVPESIANHELLAERCDLVWPGLAVLDGENRIEAYKFLGAGVGLALALSNGKVLEAAQRFNAADELLADLAEGSTDSEPQSPTTNPSGKGGRRKS